VWQSFDLSVSEKIHFDIEHGHGIRTDRVRLGNDDTESGAHFRSCASQAPPP
jgi:hypothetical protein